MTWIRLDTDFPDHESRGALAEALRIDPDRASMSLIRVWCKFGDYRQDGRADLITDTSLEEWARWTGRRGAFAAAFRRFCVDGSEGDAPGKLTGWWRQEALLRHQQGKKNRPGQNDREETAQDLRSTCEEPAPESRPDVAGNGDGNVLQPTNQPAGSGRLINALGRDPDRFTVMALFDHLPPEENPTTWATTLHGCLEGMGLESMRPCTIRQLAIACADYPTVAKSGWSPLHFRSCVDRVVRGEQRRRARRGGTTTRTERAIKEAAEWVGEGDAA